MRYLCSGKGFLPSYFRFIAYCILYHPSFIFLYFHTYYSITIDYIRYLPTQIFRIAFRIIGFASFFHISFASFYRIDFAQFCRIRTSRFYRIDFERFCRVDFATWFYRIKIVGFYRNLHCNYLVIYYYYSLFIRDYSLWYHPFRLYRYRRDGFQFKYYYQAIMLQIIFCWIYPLFFSLPHEFQFPIQIYDYKY